uniref:NADH dehydrogenase subunit 2 n=1 Tax=Philometra sp. HZ-2022 TaxID=3016125 RepID=A0A9F1U543_9BILA|nr:NADH dehydrogenase subunit 2 [Philometra sp. HZ-2022]
MLYFLGLVMVLMLMVNVLFSNVIIWWSVFVMSAVVFIWMSKVEGSMAGMVNYFIIQESGGLIFLFFSGSVLQFLMLLVMSGVAPLHFWIFSVGLDLKGIMLVWFLLVQKLPFLPIIAAIYEFVYFYILIFGLLVCHLQYLVLSSDAKMIMISSTESFSWLVVMLCWGYVSYVFLVGVYVLGMMILLKSTSKDTYVNSLGWSGLLVLMNFPLGLVFLSKYYVLSLLSSQNFIVLVLFFSVVLIYMCMALWVVGLTMTKSGLWSSNMSIYLLGSVVVLMMI